MSYLKHKNNSKAKQPKAAKKPEDATRVVVTGLDKEPGALAAPSIQHDVNYVAGMDGIEGSLDWIARGLDRLTSQDHTVNLTLGQGSNIHPVKITLAENVGLPPWGGTNG